MRYNKIHIYASLAIACVAAAFSVSSCGKIEEEVSAPKGPEKVFKVSIRADRSDIHGTKGLDIDGDEATTTNLRSIWREGDTVHVYKSSSHIGYLLATPDPSNPRHATLSGTVLTTDIMANITNLTLVTPHRIWNYSGQNGRLLMSDDPENSIEAQYNFSKASVLVTGVSDNTVTTKNATFSNQQSIYRMCFRYDNGTSKTPINARSVSIEGALNKIVRYSPGYGNQDICGSVDVTLPAATTDPFFVALRNGSESNAEKYTFTVVDSEGITYYGSKQIPSAYKHNGMFVSMKNTSLTNRLSFTVNDTEVTTAI